MGESLKGVRVLVTRPAHQAENLCRLIEAEGGTAVRLPLLTIEPGAHATEARRQLSAPRDLWIFTSANAVRHALPWIGGAWPPRLAAIGPATAAALAAAGQDAAPPLAGASSEALLAARAGSTGWSAGWRRAAPRSSAPRSTGACRCRIRPRPSPRRCAGATSSS
jgi:uroporphyrinogen-III synthase